MDKKFWSQRIQRLVPYTPGEQPKDRVFIKLNTNESPYPPAPGVLAAIRDNTNEGLRLYPDPEATGLRQAMADFYGLQPEQVFCGNGSDEVLGLCFYAFFTPGRKILFPDITYSFYPVYARLFGLDFEEIPLAEDFSMPVAAFSSAPGGAVICNPNAPTGRAVPLEEIRSILDANGDVVVIVDEAYVDFGAQSAVVLLDDYPNLVVVHTMSKSRALAGMRIGCALASPELIAAITCVKDSFNSYPLDRLAQAAGAASMADDAYFEEGRHKIIATRQWVTDRLRTMGFLVHDSSANFLFARHPGRQGRELCQALRDRGILVRRFDRPRIEEYLRITIGTDAQMQTMCRALEEILKG